MFRHAHQWEPAVAEVVRNGEFLRVVSIRLCSACLTPRLPPLYLKHWLGQDAGDADRIRLDVTTFKDEQHHLIYTLRDHKN